MRERVERAAAVREWSERGERWGGWKWTRVRVRVRDGRSGSNGHKGGAAVIQRLSCLPPCRPLEWVVPVSCSGAGIPAQHGHRGWVVPGTGTGQAVPCRSWAVFKQVVSVSVQRAEPIWTSIAQDASQYGTP
jgi:hypothetical protein